MENRKRSTDDPLAEIKRRVWEWARWFRDRAALGYPPHSWEGRAHLRGGSAPRPESAAYNLPTNDEAEEIERHVGLMDDRLRQAIIEKHIKRRTDKDAARRCHCSQAGFKERCNRAYWWLKGRLE